MCFSPEASLAGGVIITSIGVATVRKVHNPSQVVFASIPLFFGIQQFAEGLLWLALLHPGYELMQKISTYWFLTMAEVLWPALIPLSVFLMEKSGDRKRPLLWLLVLGACLSMYYTFCLVLFDVTPQIINYHIQYNNDFPQSIALWAFLLYLVVTIAPLFVSSLERTNLLGLLMFLSCLVTILFFRQYLTSVWCFFAALISGVIFWILSDSKKQFNFDQLVRMKKTN